MFAESIVSIVRALNDANALYMISGGFAAAHYGDYWRLTTVLELLAPQDGNNTNRFEAALISFGFLPLCGVRQEGISEERVFLKGSFGEPIVRLLRIDPSAFAAERLQAETIALPNGVEASILSASSSKKRDPDFRNPRNLDSFPESEHIALARGFEASMIEKLAWLQEARTVVDWLCPAATF